MDEETMPPTSSTPSETAAVATVPALHPEDRMPAWVPRAILWFMVGAGTLLLARWLLLQLRGFLMILVVSLFMSFALEPAVNWLNHRGLRRGLATGLVMLTLLVATVSFMGLMGSALFTQTSEFISDLPDRVESLEAEINQRFDIELDTEELVAEIRSNDVQRLATNLGIGALGFGMTALGVVFNLFTVALFTFYMVADGPRFRRSILSFLPSDRQSRVLEGWEIAIHKTGGYIYSRGLLALLSAVTTSVALHLLDVDYALALGLWTGLISQFIPTIGTYLAGAMPVAIAALDDPQAALYVLIFLVVYQQIENYVFAPKITARTMDLHPAVAFGTVLVGAALFGATGALIALPAAAVFQAIGSTYLERHEVIESEMTRDVDVRSVHPVSAWRRMVRNLRNR